MSMIPGCRVGSLARLLFAVVLVAALAAPARAQSTTGVRFIIADRAGQPTHNDSYTLVLTSAAHIAHARALIAQGPAAGAPIVVARIAPGGNGINRNWRSPGAPPWGWRLTEFLGFVDSTIEILDGWPTFVQSDIPGWIANTNGMIGFWNYTVVAELPPTPIFACPADFDGVGGVAVGDIFAFLSAWFAGSAPANFDGVGGVAVPDIFGFLATWFAGCP